MVSTEHIIEDEFLVNYFFSAKVGCEWNIVDNGIGYYEFWGTPGYQTTQDLELNTYEIQELTIIDIKNDIVLFDNEWDESKIPKDLMEQIYICVDSQVSELEPDDAY